MGKNLHWLHYCKASGVHIHTYIQYIICKWKLLLLVIDFAIQVQILDQAVCISYNANTLEKDMNPTILHSNMGQ